MRASKDKYGKMIEGNKATHVLDEEVQNTEYGKIKPSVIKFEETVEGTKQKPIKAIDRHSEK